MKGFRYSGFLALVAYMGLFPIGVPAQTWEVQAGWVRIDHDYRGTVTRDGEQIPDGVGVSLRRSLKRSNFSLELEISRGTQERHGAICGGFIQPGDCVPEQILYTGGVSAFSLGWLGKKQVAGVWSLGIRPEVGVGLLRAHESGKETGRSFSDWQLAASLGLGAEIAVQLPGRENLHLFGIFGLNHLQPFLVALCDDCRIIFRNSLPQTSIGLGVRWSQGLSGSGSR